ncbi:PBECR2 nuclease fold domain-containing protein [Clostridium sp. BJN0001]|uniref:PBECR3 domain-containing polyvalent protein n=1 Tax=Clostridium sp. BJN0001 TaxID=2930219 RepID=UPI001FD1144A|nr:PBECR2 nuclease fold domain-containing protein [Clostridium sp. BJN0001]
MRREYKAYKKVGKIQEYILHLLDIDFCGDVFTSPGAINHIRKKHGRQFPKKIREDILGTITKIIESPDYVGMSKKYRRNGSIELVKKMDIILFLGLEIDTEDKYIFVATLYPMTESKMIGRINSDRLDLISRHTDREKYLDFI